MRLVTEATHQQPLTSPGAMHGTGGVAQVLGLLYKTDSRYEMSYRRVNAKLAEQVLAHPTCRASAGVANGDFDAISGAAGILVYLISVPKPQMLVVQAIEELLHALIWFGMGANEPERWIVPPELMPFEGDRESFPNGIVNLGLAHGVPGPLAALSLAWLLGYRVEGQDAAIAAMSNWLESHYLLDPWGINWPTFVPAEYLLSRQKWTTLQPARAGWCYGAPGVARSLWLAGEALGDLPLQRMAIASLESVLSRPIEVRSLDSPTLCHGVSGLLVICLRFLQDSESHLIRERIPLLVEQILAACSTEYRFVVRDHRPQEEVVDCPGFLAGAAGVALALLAAAAPVEPTWDRALLIA